VVVGTCCGNTEYCSCLEGSFVLALRSTEFAGDLESCQNGMQIGDLVLE